MPIGRRNKRHLFKPWVHIGIVLAIAAATIISYRLHLVSGATPVPSGANWLIERLISTTGVIVLALMTLVVALLHKKFEQRFGVRGKVRKLFFFILTVLTGKFYTWSGLLLAMWVLSISTDIAPHSPLYLLYSPICLAVGFGVWVSARVIAFQGIRSLPPSVNRPL